MTNSDESKMSGDLSKLFKEWADWNKREAALPPEKRKKCGHCFYFCSDSHMMGAMSLVAGGEEGACLLQKARVHYQTPSCAKYRMIQSLRDLFDPEYGKLLEELKSEGYKPAGQDAVDRMRQEVQRKGINPDNTLLVTIPDGQKFQSNVSNMNLTKFPGMATNRFYSFYMTDPNISKTFKEKDAGWKIDYLKEELKLVREKGGDASKEAILLCSLALAYQENHDLDQSFNTAQEALKLAQNLPTKEPFLKIHAGNSLAAVYRDRGDFEASARVLQENLELTKEWLKTRWDKGYGALEGTILHNLGLIFREKWNKIEREKQEAVEALKTAIQYSLEGLESFRKLNDPFMVACELEIIAISYHLQNNLPEALEYYQSALNSWIKLNNQAAVTFNSNSIQTITDFLKKSEEDRMRSIHEPIPEVSSQEKPEPEGAAQKNPVEISAQEEPIPEVSSQEKPEPEVAAQEKPTEISSQAKPIPEIKAQDLFEVTITPPKSKQQTDLVQSKKQWINQAVGFKENGNLQKAVVCCEKVLRIEPECQEVWRLLNEIYKNCGSDKICGICRSYQYSYCNVKNDSIDFFNTNAEKCYFYLRKPLFS